MSVDLTIEGAVAKVVLNRPEKLNALSVEMRENLCDYFARLRFNDAVRVVIVTGAGLLGYRCRPDGRAAA